MSSPDFLDRASCAGLPSEMFFEDIWPVDDEGIETNEPDPEGLNRARTICSGCPVRLPCYEEAMQMEAGAASANRAGYRGGTTPQQRYSIWRRDAQRCIQCEETYDPLGLVAGDVVCGCGEFVEPVIPPEGDTWYPRHDHLLEKLTRYLLEKTKPGDRILPPYRMLLELGHRRKDDLPLCYDRLISDGLILRGEGRGVYYRAAGRQALASWVPPSRRRLVPGEWWQEVA